MKSNREEEPLCRRSQMTSASPKLKKILKLAIGSLILIATLTTLLIGGYIAWSFGIRLPKNHHVEQPRIPDTIDIQAIDFLDDSGYTITVHFKSCCTDQAICIGPGGAIHDEKKYYITPDSHNMKIPLKITAATICPWRFNYLVVGKNGHSNSAEDRYRFTYGIFDDSTSRPTCQLPIDCLRFLDPQLTSDTDPKNLAPQSCVDSTIKYISFKDTKAIRISRGSNDSNH